MNMFEVSSIAAAGFVVVSIPRAGKDPIVLHTLTTLAQLDVKLSIRRPGATIVVFGYIT